MSGEVLQKPGTQDEDNKTLVLDGTTDEREPGEQNKYHLNLELKMKTIRRWFWMVQLMNENQVSKTNII